MNEISAHLAAAEREQLELRDEGLALGDVDHVVLVLSKTEGFRESAPPPFLLERATFTRPTHLCVGLVDASRVKRGCE